jgi:hypothetical protein
MDPSEDWHNGKKDAKSSSNIGKNMIPVHCKQLCQNVESKNTGTSLSFTQFFISRSRLKLSREPPLPTVFDKGIVALYVQQRHPDPSIRNQPGPRSSSRASSGRPKKKSEKGNPKEVLQQGSSTTDNIQQAPVPHVRRDPKVENRKGKVEITVEIKQMQDLVRPRQ